MDHLAHPVVQIQYRGATCARSANLAPSTTSNSARANSWKGFLGPGVIKLGPKKRVLSMDIYGYYMIYIYIYMERAKMRLQHEDAKKNWLKTVCRKILIQKSWKKTSMIEKNMVNKSGKQILDWRTSETKSWEQPYLKKKKNWKSWETIDFSSSARSPKDGGKKVKATLNPHDITC